MSCSSWHQKRYSICIFNDYCFGLMNQTTRSKQPFLLHFPSSPSSVPLLPTLSSLSLLPPSPFLFLTLLFFPHCLIYIQTIVICAAASPLISLSIASRRPDHHHGRSLHLRLLPPLTLPSPFIFIVIAFVCFPRPVSWITRLSLWAEMTKRIVFFFFFLWMISYRIFFL